MNIRPPATAFVGRAAPVAHVVDLLTSGEARLVTLVGPAGVGKTRLALQIGTLLDMNSEVLVAELAAVRDAAAVAGAILRQVGAADAGVRDPIQQLSDVLRDRRAVLLLDNFEHVVSAAPVLAALQNACADLRLLVTSRRPLRLQSERVVIVEPLEVPKPESTSAQELLTTESVALLVERIRAADSTFVPSADDATALADICRRLDGLPLAIELVAPRVRVLPVTSLAAALERRLPLLVRGPLDSPQRHRTMRDALAWSADLLTASAARLLRSAAVFTGGWTLAAARAVLGDADDVELLDLHEDLVTHSLIVRHDTGGARYGMLEVVREFAREQLDASGEAEQAERRYAMHFLDVAEREAAAASVDLGRALTRLEGDRANLHAAMRWAISHAEAEIALRFGIALRMLWYVRGSLREARALFAAALELGAPQTPTRARALIEASALARQFGDFAGAARLAADGVLIARNASETWLLTYGLMQQGFALHLLETGAPARACLMESVELAREEGDDLGRARGLHHLGFVALHCERNAKEAATLQHQALALFRAHDHRRNIATCLIASAQLELTRRDLARARDAIMEAMSLVLELGDMPLLIYALHNAAALSAAEGDPERALRLAGAIDRLERLTGAAPWPAMTRMIESWLDAAVRAVGQRRAAALRRRGAELEPAAAVAYAAATAEADVGEALSRREQEIAALVADGLTNREIAARLVISERTVDGHVARVLAKLQVRSRAQIAAWVTAECG